MNALAAATVHTQKCLVKFALQQIGRLDKAIQLKHTSFGCALCLKSKTGLHILHSELFAARLPAKGLKMWCHLFLVVIECHSSIKAACALCSRMCNIDLLNRYGWLTHPCNRHGSLQATLPRETHQAHKTLMGGTSGF